MVKMGRKGVHAGVAAVAAVLGLMALSVMLAAPSAEDAEGFSHRKLQFTGLELLVLAPLAAPLLNLLVEGVSTLGQEAGAVLGFSE